jgi:predicted GNAT family acetyltransferase
LPNGAKFNAAANRITTEKIFSLEQLLVAELDNQLVGKINTSAQSYSYFLIGGVYVHPSYRNKGIAQCMTKFFVNDLIRQNKDVILFVKKENRSAVTVYQKTGFDFFADYRINYY